MGQTEDHDCQAHLEADLNNVAAERHDTNWNDKGDEAHTHHGRRVEASLIHALCSTWVVCAELGERTPEEAKAWY